MDVPRGQSLARGRDDQRVAEPAVEMLVDVMLQACCRAPLVARGQGVAIFRANGVDPLARQAEAGVAAEVGPVPELHAFAQAHPVDSAAGDLLEPEAQRDVAMRQLHLLIGTKALGADDIGQPATEADRVGQLMIHRHAKDQLVLCA